jgi:hypothetical protein
MTRSARAVVEFDEAFAPTAPKMFDRFPLWAARKAERWCEYSAGGEKLPGRQRPSRRYGRTAGSPSAADRTTKLFLPARSLFAAWFGIGEIETLLKTVRLNPAEFSLQFLIAKADWLELRLEPFRHQERW